MQDPIADFLHWYKSRPLVTKTYLTISTIIAILLSTGMLSIHQLYYQFNTTYSNLQIWRPLTSLLFLGQLNFAFILQSYFAYFALISSERDIFEQKDIANYWTLLIYVFSMMTLVASFIDLYFISHGFIFALIYVWCRVKPFRELRLIFGLNLQSGYFPWVYLGVTVLMGQSFINLVAGFLIAYLYLYIKGPIYQKFKIDFLKTPSLLHSLAKIYNNRLAVDQVEQQGRESQMRGQQQNEDDLYN